MNNIIANKRHKLFAIIFSFIPVIVWGQVQVSNKIIENYFKEIKEITEQHAGIWNKNLYAPILLVDHQTQQLYANEPDSAGILNPHETIYIGDLPGDLSIANTSIHWNGKDWAMIILAAIPPEQQERINLFAHELFHVAQPALGFKMANVDNNHLDQKEGRIYLRLELEALKKALQTTSISERTEHLTHALIFRKYRNALYAGSDDTENALELNEGLAEYTGIMHTDYNQEQRSACLAGKIDNFFQVPTFVRSFAYQTIPVYGYLLYQTKKEWNKEISANTLLADYFINEFKIKLPAQLKNATEEITGKYDGKAIFAEETQRDELNKKRIAEYKAKFIEQPHLDIYFEQMNISFDPRNLMPLEDKGTVYPNFRIIDRWGILTVENGALLAPNWKKVSLSLPFKEEADKFTGDGWTLELKGEYELLMDDATKNYTMIKKN